MTDQSSVSQVNSGTKPTSKALPDMARRRLSRAGYQLLEACRAFAPGMEGDTTYERLMKASGLRSRASIAKALRELDRLTVIDHRIRRTEHGQVAGLWIQYRGIPDRTPDGAKAAFREAALKERTTLVEKLKHLELEIKQLETGEET